MIFVGEWIAGQSAMLAGGSGSTQAVATNRTASGRVVGVVVAASSGLPLRLATIVIDSPDNADETVTTTTGPDGRYDSGPIPFGRYIVKARKPGYVESVHGSSREGDSGTPIELREETSIRVNLSLSRAGVITGLVLDESGEPVDRVVVRALRREYSKGKRELVSVGQSSTTNDIGAFRLYGLSPGDYIVSASSPPIFGDIQNAKAAFSPTYFPQAATLTEAQLVHVAAGDTVSGIVIGFRPSRAAQISGIVVDAGGVPWTSGFVNVTLRSEYQGLGVASGSIGADGTFTVSGVPHGNYFLRADDFANRADGFPRMATASVAVSGQDISGLTLASTPWGSVTGRIIIDRLSQNAPVASTVRLKVERVGPRDDELEHLGGVQVRSDWTFRASGPTGKIRIRAIALPEGWAISRVSLNGRDVTDTGMDLSSGRAEADLEVELSDRGPLLSGIVTNGKSQVVAGATVIVFPEDPELRSWNSRHIAMARTDKAGEFTIPSLPAGTYRALALDAVDPGQERDADFLAELDSRGISFSLARGDSNFIALQLVQR